MSNLILLRDYLASLPMGYKHFEMNTFYKTTMDYWGLDLEFINEHPLNECGTVACMVGHAPAAGVDVSDCQYWYDVQDVLAEPSFQDYLFHENWADHDNTIKGGVKRLTKVINGFIPTDDDLPWNE